MNACRGLRLTVKVLERKAGSCKWAKNMLRKETSVTLISLSSCSTGGCNGRIFRFIPRGLTRVCFAYECITLTSEDCQAPSSGRTSAVRRRWRCAAGRCKGHLAVTDDSPRVPACPRWGLSLKQTDAALSEARCCTNMKQQRLTGRWLAYAFREFHSSGAAHGAARRTATGRMFLMTAAYVRRTVQITRTVLTPE